MEQKIRAGNKRIPIPKDELWELYVIKEFSAPEIAAKYRCGTTTILNRLRDYEIPLRPPGKAKVSISKSELTKLYNEQGLSLKKIARQYGCDPDTIGNKIEEYGLEKRSYAKANDISQSDFEGDLVDKAYLIGFRLGGLYAKAGGANGQTVIVGCFSKRQEQIDLMKSLFGAYGRMSITERSTPNSKVRITCYLNRSFAFLLPKEDTVPEWVQTDTAVSTAFAAGYIDAKGHFSATTEDRSARFLISSCDKNITHWLYQWMINYSIHCLPPRVLRYNGAIQPNDSTFRKDTWRVLVLRNESLLRLIEILKPYLKHAKRLTDMEKVEQIVKARITKGMEKR